MPAQNRNDLTIGVVMSIECSRFTIVSDFDHTLARVPHAGIGDVTLADEPTFTPLVELLRACHYPKL